MQFSEVFSPVTTHVRNNKLTSNFYGAIIRPMVDWKKLIADVIEKDDNPSWNKLYNAVTLLAEKRLSRFGLQGRYTSNEIAHEAICKLWKNGHFKKLYDQDAESAEIYRYITKTIDSVINDIIKGPKPSPPTVKDYKDDNNKPADPMDEILDNKFDPEQLINAIAQEEIKVLVKQPLKRTISTIKNPTQRRIAEELFGHILFENADEQKPIQIARKLDVSPALITYVKKHVISCLKEDKKLQKLWTSIKGD